MYCSALYSGIYIKKTGTPSDNSLTDFRLLYRSLCVSRITGFIEILFKCKKKNKGENQNTGRITKTRNTILGVCLSHTQNVVQIVHLFKHVYFRFDYFARMLLLNSPMVAGILLSFLHTQVYVHHRWVQCSPLNATDEIVCVLHEYVDLYVSFVVQILIFLDVFGIFRRHDPLFRLDLGSKFDFHERLISSSTNNINKLKYFRETFLQLQIYVCVFNQTSEVQNQLADEIRIKCSGGKFILQFFIEMVCNSCDLLFLFSSCVRLN